MMGTQTETLRFFLESQVMSYTSASSAVKKLEENRRGAGWGEGLTACKMGREAGGGQA